MFIDTYYDTESSGLRTRQFLTNVFMNDIYYILRKYVILIMILFTLL